MNKLEKNKVSKNDYIILMSIYTISILTAPADSFGHLARSIRTV
jgi:hypothetical protein